MQNTSFVASQVHTPEKRKLKKVPFVELHCGRLQGVVSSGSSIERVYVSWIEGKTGHFYCSTNNNRPCGGLRGGTCKHIDALLSNAISQYGGERVQVYLGAVSVPHYGGQIVAELGGSQRKESSGEVFSRFLDFLRYVDLGKNEDVLPEMRWFVGG